MVLPKYVISRNLAFATIPIPIYDNRDEAATQ